MSEPVRLFLIALAIILGGLLAAIARVE